MTGQLTSLVDEDWLHWLTTWNYQTMLVQSDKTGQSNSYISCLILHVSSRPSLSSPSRPGEKSSITTRAQSNSSPPDLISHVTSLLRMCCLLAGNDFIFYKSF